MKFFRTGQKGFTLIELLVVISILGVLAAVVILNVTKYMNAGFNEAKATEKANVQTAYSAYLYDNNGVGFTGDIGTKLSPYFLGTPHGSYSINADGSVSQTAYP